MTSMKKLFALILLLPLLALSQVTTNPGVTGVFNPASPGAIGGTTPAAITGTTITATTGQTGLTVGTTGTNAGIIGGYAGSSGYGALWASDQTTTTSNYGLRMSANSTELGGPTGVFVQLAPFNTVKLRTISTAGYGVDITAGTAASAVNALNITQTRNFSGSATDYIKAAFTLTSTHASDKILNLYAGAGGATSVFSVDTVGGLIASGAATVSGAFSPGSWTSTTGTGYMSSSYTGTLTGCTTSPTVTVSFVRVGNSVVLSLDAQVTATSNATTMTITGGPVDMRPLTQRITNYRVFDNGAWSAGMVQIETNGTLTFIKDISGTAFTGSGTKGAGVFSIAYNL